MTSLALPVRAGVPCRLSDVPQARPGPVRVRPARSTLCRSTLVRSPPLRCRPRAFRLSGGPRWGSVPITPLHRFGPCPRRSRLRRPVRGRSATPVSPSRVTGRSPSVPGPRDGDVRGPEWSNRTAVADRTARGRGRGWDSFRWPRTACEGIPPLYDSVVISRVTADWGERSRSDRGDLWRVPPGGSLTAASSHTRDRVVGHATTRVSGSDASSRPPRRP
jgi:hypothetical protein